MCDPHCYCSQESRAFLSCANSSASHWKMLLVSMANTRNELAFDTPRAKRDTKGNFETSLTVILCLFLFFLMMSLLSQFILPGKQMPLLLSETQPTSLKKSVRSESCALLPCSKQVLSSQQPARTCALKLHRNASKHKSLEPLQTISVQKHANPTNYTTYHTNYHFRASLCE